MAPKNARIAIIGGGIGGLTTAISLLQAGFDVQVYEQSRLLSEVGAGINISPNASRILIRLGLGEECARVAFRSPFFHQRRYNAVLDFPMRPQRRFNLSELDALAANLDLPIVAAEKFEIAVRQITREIAGAKQSSG